MLVYGRGGHARVVIAALQRGGHTLSGFFDDVAQPGSSWNDRPVLGPYDAALESSEQVVVAIGDNATRERIQEGLKHLPGTIIDPSVILAEDVRPGLGSMLLHGVIVQTGTVIGEGVILNTACRIDHDVHIDAYAHVAPAATLLGSVTVGRGALIGAGAVVLPGKKVGAWAQVGAGAVVTQDVPPGVTVVGNPAKQLVKQ